MPMRGPWWPSNDKPADIDMTHRERGLLNLRHLAWEMQQQRLRTPTFDYPITYRAWQRVRVRVNDSAWWMLYQIFRTQQRDLIRMRLATRAISRRCQQRREVWLLRVLIYLAYESKPLRGTSTILVPPAPGSERYKRQPVATRPVPLTDLKSSLGPHTAKPNLDKVDS